MISEMTTARPVFLSRCVFSVWCRGIGRRHLQRRLHFADSVLEAALDFRNCIALSEVTGLVEVLEISAQFLKKFLGKTVTHRKSIVATFVHSCKVTRF
jgi:hypothetical protein